MSELPENWLETELGLLPVTWQPVEAQQFCKKVADGTHDSPKKQESGKLLITSKNIKDSRLDVESAYHISFDDYIEVNRRSKVDQWDVLLSMIGTVGEVCLIDEEPDFAIKNVGLFKCGDEIKGKWLYYFLKSKGGQHYIYSRLSGTTQKYITLGELRKLPIPSPSPPEQKAIAGVLSAFDEKIELLREQNETLETIAQTIFKEWFVNFNYSGATGEMIDSELGEIPKGWRVGTLSDVTTLLAGGDKPKNATDKETATNKIPIYSNGITNEGLYGFTDTPKVFEESVTVSARGTIGFVCLRFSPYVPIVRLISIIPIKEYLSSKYLFFWLKSQNISGFGTTQQQLTIPVFRKTTIVIPSSELMSNFTELADLFYYKIKNNTAQLQTLSKTRDTLLPKLMSGEVRTKGFEQ